MYIVFIKRTGFILPLCIQVHNIHFVYFFAKRLSRLQLPYEHGFIQPQQQQCK